MLVSGRVGFRGKCRFYEKNKRPGHIFLGHEIFDRKSDTKTCFHKVLAAMVNAIVDVP